MTPVLAAVPAGTLIWIVLLIIGAVGSIVSNARKATAAKAQPQARQAVPTRQEQIREQLRQQLAAQLGGTLHQQAFPQAPSPPPPAAVPPPPRPMVMPPPPPPMPTAPAPHGTSAFRGMFERGNLARSIVAAEVLGPPKSLREQ